MLSTEQKQSLTDTAGKYHQSINQETLSYLQSRGIEKDVVDMFLFGTVSNPAPGHEHAVGALSIPYITNSGIVGIKFRKIDGTMPKYIWPTGQKIGLYNVSDLMIDTETIAICEGELDTVIMSGLCDIPAVGIAGVTQWREWFPMMFEGYRSVYVFADNDVKEDGRNPGMELAKRIKEDISKAVVIQLPENKDVNDLYLSEGPEWFKDKIQ